MRDRNKYERILDFARAAAAHPRAASHEDMSKRGMPREKVLATVVSLLDKTLIRVGNGDYAKENGSFGLTTLRMRHLEVEGSELRFHFKGKSGKTWRLSMQGPAHRAHRALDPGAAGAAPLPVSRRRGRVRSIDSTT